MPWRLVVVIVIFALFITFVALNLDDSNKCDINFGFIKILDAPVFLTIFISFALGLFCAFPMLLHRSIKSKKEKPQKDNRLINDSYSPSFQPKPETDDKVKQDAASARERFFAKRRDDKK